MEIPEKYQHDRIKSISLTRGAASELFESAFELTDLPDRIKRHTERVFLTIPFTKDEVPMIEEGLGEVFEWVVANGKKGGGYTVIDAGEEGAMHINICMGCTHRMVSEITGNHPENASDEEIANAVFELAFRGKAPPCQDE
jgi:hypothetical protein